MSDSEHLEKDSAAVNKLKDLLRDIPVCMFVTHLENDQVTSRPMTTAKIDDDGNVWFFANMFGETVVEESNDNSVYLVYAHPGHNTYVHITGYAHIVLDREKIEALWNPLMKAWYPGGIDDPKLCLLKVITEEAKYWNASSNKMVIFFNMLKAIARKDEYHDGETGKLNLNDSARTAL